MKINPKGYVPTALMGVENLPVCESKDIIALIDEKYEGIRKLQNACEQDPEIMERYKEFLDLHQQFDVENFSLGSIQDNYLIRYLLPIMMFKGINKVMEKMKTADVELRMHYQNKLYVWKDNMN